MSFYGVTDIWAYLIGAIGIILLPGPNSLYVLSTATAQGVKRGYQAACGVFVGDSVLLLFVALGAAGLLRTYPTLFMIVKYAGAAYLSWVGLNLLWGAYQKYKLNSNKSSNDGREAVFPSDLTMAHNSLQGIDATRLAVDAQDFNNPKDDGRNTAALAITDMNHPFTKALVISLLNPKAILFLLSFFIQFIDPNYPTFAVPFLILATILMFLSFVYLSVIIFAGAKLADEFKSRHTLSAFLSSCVGGMFIWFAAKLATSSLR